MSALSTWEHRVSAFASDEWVIVPIDVDFSGAVTLVATISATMAEGQPFPDAPPHRFEYGLNWLLQDSLSGKDWHDLGRGQLRHSIEHEVARVSTPMGTRARLCLLPMVIAAMDPRGASYRSAEGWGSHWESMDLQRPADVFVHIVVRSI
jgi:hypothetical protein